MNNIEDMSVLNDQAFKYDENQIPVSRYREGANLKSYIDHYCAVLDYFSDKTPDARFFVFGHSQGTRIAAALVDNQQHMLKLQQPILFVYGTNDYGISLDADKIPISFIKEGKTNLAVKAYEGRDHNFFKGKDYGWNQVMEDCMNWFLY